MALFLLAEFFTDGSKFVTFALFFASVKELVKSIITVDFRCQRIKRSSVDGGKTYPT